MEIEIIISNSSNDPIYEQIKEQIKAKIIHNELKVGEMLPSIRSLARDLRISVITVKTAYEQLETEGFIFSRQGKGFFIADKNVELIREEQLQRVEKLIDHAVQIAKVSNITKEELEEMLKILYEGE